MYIIKQNYEDQISMTKMVMKPLKHHLHKYLTKTFTLKKISKSKLQILWGQYKFKADGPSISEHTDIQPINHNF